MKRILLFLLMLGFIGITQVFSQESGNFLSQLEGQWATKGKAFNMPADIKMEWKKVLLGKYMHLTYEMIMDAGNNTKQAFEGTAYYKSTGPSTFEAVWMDSQSEMHPIKANTDGGTLTSIWGTPGKKLGKTTYRLIDKNTVEIVDYVQKPDQSWSEFNRNTLSKR